MHLNTKLTGGWCYTEHIDASSLEVVAKVIASLREEEVPAHAHENKLFVLLAVRFSLGAFEAHGARGGRKASWAT